MMMFLLIFLSPLYKYSANILIGEFCSLQLIGVLRGNMKLLSGESFFNKIEYQTNLGNEDSYLQFMRIRPIILEMVSKVFRVSTRDILAKSRSQAHIAFARQVAMYLTHICCGLNLTQTGKLFDRDRTTVAYACNLVEDRRDESNFDLTLEILEKTIREFALQQREVNIYAL